VIRALVIATAVTAGAATAAAQPAQLVNAIAGDKAGVDHMTLVGESAQLYAPVEGGWQREHAGGIAGDVEAVAKAKDGTIFVAGGRAPLYELDGGAWNIASLGVRQRSRAHSLTGIPVVSSGRNVYMLDGDRWRRVASTPGRVELIWASAKNKIYVADDSGEIARGDGRRWTTISNAFTPPETPVRFVGVPGKALYAVGDAGTIVDVGGAAARKVKLPAELTGLQVTAGGAAKGVVYFAGTVGEDQVLAKVNGAALERVDALPALDAGDRYSLVAGDKTGALLVASYAGTVRVRAADGTWSDRTLSIDLPDEAPVAARDGRKPARTQ
jgi:hypothetical protein